ncbi:hypothetical protein COB64_03780 [Candidatus Wolfebacteria bacterium]|nr:MAG: hypothetical protein COB64_03780 [Candidatus Wolfebacteria bacterium]
MKSRLCIYLLLSLFTYQSAFAWNHRGHKIVAAIAYSNLDKPKQIEMTDILKHHPDYNDWSLDFKEMDNIDFGMYLFMRASTWPDEIRRSGHEHDHQFWHYVTYKMNFVDGHTTDRPEPEDDVLYGISESIDRVSDDHNSMSVRAMYLSWLIHLVGDIHQPLHCASLFSEKFPKGDRGGNKIFLIFKQGWKAKKLHSYWDGLLGGGKSYPSMIKDVNKYLKSHPKSAYANLLKEKDPKAWSIESFNLAVKVAHLNGEVGKLKGIKNKDSAPLVPKPDDYYKNAKSTAESQITLASYRLAKLIEEF